MHEAFILLIGIRAGGFLSVFHYSEKVESRAPTIMGCLLQETYSTHSWNLPSFYLQCLIAIVIALFSVTTRPTILFAAPEPIPEKELIELCDLVIAADIVSVRRLHPQEGSLLAQARVIEISKGTARVGQVVDVYFGLPSGAPGDSGIAIYPGEKLKLFLLETEPGKVNYYPFPHNEAVIIKKVEPAQQVLPQQPGDVIYAPGQEPRSIPSQQYRIRRFRLFRRR